MKDAGIELLPEAEEFVKAYLDENPQYKEQIPDTPEPWPDLSSNKDEWVIFLTNYPGDSFEWDHDQNAPRYDYWSSLCEKQPVKAFECLKEASDLVRDLNNWPAVRWDTALHTWGRVVEDQDRSELDEKKNQQNLKPENILSYLNEMNTQLLDRIAFSATNFIKSAVPALVQPDPCELHDQSVLNFISTIVENSANQPSAAEPFQTDEVDDFDLMTRAINSTLGHATSIAITYQLRKSPKYSDGLHDSIQPIFESILNLDGVSQQYGCVKIAERAIDFYLWDKNWSDANLIPLFLSDDNNISNAMWSGYFFNGRWTPDFIAATKQKLLELPLDFPTGDHVPQHFANLLMNVYVHGDNILSDKEIQKCIGKITPIQLNNFLWSLVKHMEAAEQKGEFYKRFSKPFFENIWPKDIKKIQSIELAWKYLEIILASDSEFEDAVTLLKENLNFPPQTVPYWIPLLRHYAGEKVSDVEDGTEKRKPEFSGNYAERFPEKSLELLVWLPLDQIVISKDKLMTALKSFQNLYRKKGLDQDPNYIKLNNMIRNISLG
jgi:hypothetical protein